jgi:hypothetical protein
MPWDHYPCHETSPNHTQLWLEMANTPERRERGLMDRTALAPHTGMLFSFPQEGHVDFWMKNTLIPLDMVFINDGYIVTQVHANVPVAPPGTPDDRLPIYGGEARFVIELPAGEAAADGFVTGVPFHITKMCA